MENNQNNEKVLAHRAWWATRPVALVITDAGMRMQFEHGSKGLSKMMEFKKNYHLDNQIIDAYMEMKPQRYDNETPEDFKIRCKFQKALVKYRAFVYSYNTTKKQARKMIKKLNKINQNEINTNAEY